MPRFDLAHVENERPPKKHPPEVRCTRCGRLAAPGMTTCPTCFTIRQRAMQQRRERRRVAPL